MTNQTSTNSNNTAQLARVMGIWSLALYGAGDMLGAGVYGLVGRAAGQMGNAVWLAFIASMVAALCTGLSYAEIGSRYPKAAGAAFVVQRSFGKKFLSYVVGLATMASGLTSMAAGSRVFSGYLQAALGGPDVVPLLALVIIFLLFLTAVNIWGMRESVILNVICTIIEIFGLLLVIAVGLKYWGSIDYFETPISPTTGEPVGLGALLVLQGAVLTFYSFVGFEDMLNVSEEVKNPEKTFPIAMIIALSITTVIYISVSITAVSVIPHADLAKSTQPLVDVVKTAAPWFPPVVFSIIAMFAVANTALLNYIMGSRLIYGMAAQGLLPSFLDKIHAKRQTPHRAILVMLAIVLILAFIGDISVLAKATSVLLLTVFIIVNASLIVLKRRPNEPKGRFRVPSFVPACGIIVCLAMLSQTSSEEQVIAIVILGAISALYFFLRPKTIPE